MSAPGAAQKQPRKRGLLARLRSRYRLVLIDDRTFEERFSARLNRLSVLVFAVLGALAFGALITALIVFTPLKRFIPGYSDEQTRINAYRGTLKADSLQAAMAEQRAYVENLRAVLTGELPLDSASLKRPAAPAPGSVELAPGVQDSALRARVDREERYSLVEGGGVGERRELASVLFVPPVQGIVTSAFDRAKGHYGIDIVTAPDAAVKSCLSGTVALASWTTDAGHVLAVQHGNGLVSLYKHNRVLLKKAGDRVNSGEALAIVGDTGENSTGPHLHFELWHNGSPVDPAAYMVFQ
jgi:murein DD-endopeptidase MepM/ murein hydrolase activator NlpD